MIVYEKNITKDLIVYKDITKHLIVYNMYINILKDSNKALLSNYTKWLYNYKDIVHKIYLSIIILLSCIINMLL